MIDSLYQLTKKGYLKALSFVLATAMFTMILSHSALFAQHFGGTTLYRALLIFYGMAILWIHGVGFDIQTRVWRAIFLPLVGYFIVISALIYLMFLK